MFHFSKRHLVMLLLVPLAVVLAAYVITVIPYLKYTRGFYLLLGFVLVADLAALLRGAWRDAGIVIATVIFGLAIGEMAFASIERDISTESRGFSVARSVVGWGPATPGVYHGFRKAKSGRVIYDADYTIDRDLLRRTISAENGPTVAFFGDSMTFGQGLSDADTLPQAYADLTGRKFRVLNFGFPGYGPQQMLHVLDSGLFSWLLTDAKVFVYETAAWHAERAACLANFMARAPRYAWRDGKLVFVGACEEGFNRFLLETVFSSAIYQSLIAPQTNAVRAADIELYIAEIENSARLTKQKYGAHFVVLYLPGSDAYLAKSGFTDAMIEDRLKSAGIEVIDAALSEKDFPPGTLLAIPGDGHPSAIANRARAALLQQYLARTNMSVVAMPGEK